MAPPHGLSKIVALSFCTFIGLAGLVGCQTGADADQTSRTSNTSSTYGYATPERNVADQRNASAAETMMYYPTGRRDSAALQIRVTGPREIPLGQPYTYTVNVTNMTQSPMTNVVVRNVHVVENESGATSLGYAPPSSTSSRDERDSTARTDRTQDSRSADSRTVAQAPPSNQERTRAGESSQSQSQAEWSIGHLNPGETRSITIRGDAQQVGQLRQCLAIDYTPTVCTTLHVVNPELQATLTGPKQLLICEPADYTLTVRNVGTGTARNVRIASSLPNGITTREGQRELALTVGDLGPNQSRDLRIQFRPATTGEFTIQPQVVSDIGELKVQPMAIRVQQPVLDVQVRGPQWQYLGQPLVYQVTVKNTGDGPANSTVVEVNARGMSGDLGRRDLGSIAPGQSKTADFKVERLESGMVRDSRQDINFAVEARAHCAETRTASAVTQIRTIPALLLETVDTVDPVQVGQTTVYQIAVRNQGSGAASNVRLTAKLPKGLEFVSATGDSNIRADGQSLTFDPLPQLAAGATARWAVTARATGSDMVQFELELRSDDLDEAAIENEPTRLYDPNQPAPERPENPRDDDDDDD